MPFKSFDQSSIEVASNAAAIIVVNAAPLVRLGIVSALRIQASLHGQTMHHGADLAEVEAALEAAPQGSLLICDMGAWTATEQDATGRRDRLRERNVADMDCSAHRMLQLRGVSGVVSASCQLGELEKAVAEIGEGRTWFKGDPAAVPSGMSKLSCRQIEILELMTRGLLNKQIAWELGVTEGTVKSHVSAILEKLGCDRRTQAIAAFLQTMGVGRQPTQGMLHA